MPIIRNRTIDRNLSSADLFCNMSASKAFRIIETYKNIRTALLFTLSSGEDNAFVVTSAEPNSGKSVTSANLGLSFAQNGLKILIIDCDMRNPSQHKIFEKDNTAGLSDILGGMKTFTDVVKRDVKENLDLLTAGSLSPNPSELLGSERMRALLEEVKPQYEFVIMDSPPAGFVSDTLSLLLNAPQAIMIARQNHAVYNEVAKAVELIKGVGGHVLGAILTDVREQNKSYGYTYHAYRYRGDRYRSSKYRRRYGSQYGYGYGYGYGYAKKRADAEQKTEDEKKAETAEPVKNGGGKGRK